MLPYFLPYRSAALLRPAVDGPLQPSPRVLRAAETVEESRLDVALDRDPDTLLERDLVLVKVARDVRPREHGALPRPGLIVLLLKGTKF